MISKTLIKASLGILLINGVLLICCGCATNSSLGYQAPIQQGNLVNKATIAKLHAGMAQQEVRQLLGTPVIIDPYNTSSWTYIYRLQENGRLSQAHHLVAHFTPDKRLDRFETDTQ